MFLSLTICASKLLLSGAVPKHATRRISPAPGFMIVFSANFTGKEQHLIILLQISSQAEQPSSEIVYLLYVFFLRNFAIYLLAFLFCTNSVTL